MAKSELQNVPIPTAVMMQVGIDLCNLRNVDGYCCLIVCIDYFSKWSEAKPVKDKTAPTTAQFIYEIMCRHGCFSVQINAPLPEENVQSPILHILGKSQPPKLS